MANITLITVTAVINSLAALVFFLAWRLTQEKQRNKSISSDNKKMREALKRRNV